MGGTAHHGARESQGVGSARRLSGWFGIFTDDRAMRRRQLFEFNESQWFPQLLRDYETDYLETLMARWRPQTP